MSLPTLTVSRRLRELLAYDKLAGPRPRVLVLRGQYWLDDACLRAAEGLGWERCAVNVRMEGRLTRETYADLLRALGAFRPDFILSVNLSGMDIHGMLARLLADLHMPHVAWFVDNPRTILMDRSVYATKWSVAAVWDRAYADYLKSAGFERVIHLPLAADLTVFNADPATSWRFPPTFVGDSNTALAEREWPWVEARPELAAAVRHALDNGRATREAFAAGLEAMVGENVVAALDPEARRHGEYLLFTEGTRRLRRRFVQALDPEGIEVRGDQGWAGHCPRLGPPLHYENALPAFYRDCEVNLNVTSIQMPTAVNQRVFDCPAAGGFLLTDAQSDLEVLFDPEEVARYRSFDECRDRLRHYCAHPEARIEVTRRARERILACHTYAHRLQAIAHTVQETFCR